MDKLSNYFSGDAMAISAWTSKYQMKDPSRPDEVIESTPDDMHMRLAKEFAEVEYNYIVTEMSSDTNKWSGLSKFGKDLYYKRVSQSKEDIVDELFSYFKGFNGIVPQGSIMSNLGNKYVFGSLSNCFGIAPPLDSYGGILRTDEELVQLMKRRGGVGTHLNNIRPAMSLVTNASKSSTGVPSFAERFSNTTREVAQEGRRGALMLLLLVLHPDIFRFVTMKDDRTKVTGANVTVMFTDEFMKAVEAGLDFLCRFPVDVKLHKTEIDFILNYQNTPYNQLFPLTEGRGYVMKISAKELFDTFVDMAHANAEPGAAFIDRIIDYSPDGVYEAYIPELCNPCGEQWFHRNDTCRLIAENLFGVVVNPFTNKAYIDFDRLYEISYMQQRLGDDLVDLEAEYIDRIIDKIISDPEPEEIKAVELNLWKKIKELALSGRRTGNGFTGLGDMLAAILQPYFSPEIVEEVMKTKMRAELDATIDMAILRGPFVGWDSELEFGKTERIWIGIEEEGNSVVSFDINKVSNSFYKMLCNDFPDQAGKMIKYGRRNVSWSTVAPTGTVSLMTQTTSGLEPLFKAFYIRRKKVNANEKGIRIDFVDQNGDSWQEYPILHPKFKEWIKIYLISNIEFTEGLLKGYKLQSRDVDMDLVGDLIDFMDKEKIEELFRLSPWYGSQAEDIGWEERIKINAIIQKYTSNSLSCTVNLPEDIDKETVHNLYFYAWKAGLKGITVYREGSRSGVLLSDNEKKKETTFDYRVATERPNKIDAEYHFVKNGGKEFGVIIGMLEGKPYEVFAFTNPLQTKDCTGSVVKLASKQYRFESDNLTIDNIQTSSNDNERLLTRWASLSLRHGASPKTIVEQVEKSEVNITNFSKAIARVLKTYIKDGESSKEKCPECGEETLIRSEGCKKCTNCSYSKC